MSKTSERITGLEYDILILRSEKQSCQQELSDLLENLKGVKAKKADLQKEVELRRRIEEIDEEISLKENQIKALEKDKKGNAVVTSIGIIALAALMGVTACSISKSKNCSAKNVDRTTTESTIEGSTLKPTEGQAELVIDGTPVAIVTPEPTAVPVLVDVTNEEEVVNAADRLINDEITSVLEGENDAIFTSSFNKEDVEDIIRVLNGELPKYSEYDEYTIGETVNMMNDILANKGSVGNKLYPVHFSKLYPDGSKEAKYVESYDEIYNKIAEYRSTNNVDGFVEMVGVLGTKLYKEWHLAGLYGGYNPYSFDFEKQYFLLQAATSRFSNYVREYLEANDLTVCIDTCVIEGTTEHKLVEVRDIFEALYMGTSRNGEISVWRSGEVINVFGVTFADAKNYLDNKAQENVKVLR